MQNITNLLTAEDFSQLRILTPHKVRTTLATNKNQWTIYILGGMVIFVIGFAIGANTKKKRINSAPDGSKDIMDR